MLTSTDLPCGPGPTVGVINQDSVKCIPGLSADEYSSVTSAFSNLVKEGVLIPLGERRRTRKVVGLMVTWQKS